VGSRETIYDLVDGSIATHGDDEVDSFVSGSSGQVRGMSLSFRLGAFDLELRGQRMLDHVHG
jgi:hypothetical protein